MNNIKMTVLAVSLVGSTAVSRASGPQFAWQWDLKTGAYSPGAGVINDVMATFNNVTKNFTFEVNFGKGTQSNGLTDGFMIALSPGPNPKGYAGELAALYFDGSQFVKGKGGPELTVYGYNGKNGFDSFKDGSQKSGNQEPDRILSSLLDKSWINELKIKNENDGTRTMKIDIDATAIQNHIPKYPGPGGPSEWTGVGFGDKLGLWFKTVDELETEYDKGWLEEFDFEHSGYLDGSNYQTVPEPVTIMTLGALAALALRRKKA